MVLNRNIFKDTSVVRQGGALYLSYVNVTNCIFENASTTATGSSNGGGAIYGSSFNLKNNTMTNCVAKSGNGNYIFASYDFNGVVTILEGKTVDITSSTFTLNATVTDDMGHPIHGGSYTFKLNDIAIGSASSVNGFIAGTFSKLLDDGKYTVTVSGPLNDNAVVKKATANVKIDMFFFHPFRNGQFIKINHKFTSIVLYFFPKYSISPSFAGTGRRAGVEELHSIFFMIWLPNNSQQKSFVLLGCSS